MKRADRIAAFAAYTGKFKTELPFTTMAMSREQIDAAAEACAAAVERGRALSQKESSALEPAREEGMVF